MFCVINGMPYEAVFGPLTAPLSRERRHAISVVIGEFRGGRYDWESLSWAEPPRLVPT